ncbi:MAG: hypothetical protein V4714_06375 [Bacteroidota bacterium]
MNPFFTSLRIYAGHAFWVNNLEKSMVSKKSGPEPMEKDYYVSRSMNLAKELDAKMKFFKLVLYRSFSNAEVNEIVNTTLRVFMEMIPGIPYVGGDKNPLTEALIVSSWFESLYKSLKKFDTTDDEISEISKAIANEISRFELKNRSKLEKSASQKMLKQISALKPLLQSFIPGPPKKQLQEDFIVTYVCGSTTESDKINTPGKHTVVDLSNTQNETSPFRHTYKINYWNNHFSSIEMIWSEVAVNM